MRRVLLASESPRRRELMNMTEIPFFVASAKIEENIDKSLPIGDAVAQLAKQKAAIWAIILSGLVLGSAVHKIIWNLPFEDKDKKEKSSFQDSNELKTIIESKLGFAYDAENNTFSMGGK